MSRMAGKVGVAALALVALATTIGARRAQAAEPPVCGYTQCIDIHDNDWCTYNSMLECVSTAFCGVLEWKCCMRDCPTS